MENISKLLINKLRRQVMRGCEELIKNPSRSGDQRCPERKYHLEEGHGQIRAAI